MGEMELLPCPFCGGAAELHCIGTSSGGAYNLRFARMYSLRCSECGIEKAKEIAVRFDWCPYDGVKVDDSEMRAATDAWNKRAIIIGVDFGEADDNA